MNWKDTIEVVLTFGDYTLIHYLKGGHEEWNVAYQYNAESKSWANGNYCYSLESAIATCLRKMDSNLVKSRYQRDIESETGLTFERLDELATLFKDGLIEDDYDSAIEYFNDTCDMTEEEKVYFGIEEEDEDE